MNLLGGEIQGYLAQRTIRRPTSRSKPSPPRESGSNPPCEIVWGAQEAARLYHESKWTDQFVPTKQIDRLMCTMKVNGPMNLYHENRWADLRYRELFGV